MSLRNATTDYFHNFRFHASTVGPGGIDYLDSQEAGFNTCTTPEYTLEATEYREGIYVYTRKFPGLPTVSDVTLGRGVTRRESSFYEWMIRCIEGGEYRATLTIYHYHRVGFDPGEQASREDQNFAKKYVCYNCIPIRLKIAGDLDATAADVSIAEMDVAMERFEVQQPSESYEAGWAPDAYLSSFGGP